ITQDPCDSHGVHRRGKAGHDALPTPGDRIGKTRTARSARACGSAGTGALVVIIAAAPDGADSGGCHENQVVASLARDSCSAITTSSLRCNSAWITASVALFFMAFSRSRR